MCTSTVRVSQLPSPHILRSSSSRETVWPMRRASTSSIEYSVGLRSMMLPRSQTSFSAVSSLKSLSSMTFFVSAGPCERRRSTRTRAKSSSSGKGFLI